MNLLYLILPLALLIVAGFVAAFVWATRMGQFDDLETPAMRALFDDAEVVKEPASENRDQ
jgi:cbb3-type cytochrome oxidase maturation protein